jgi:hypothetical protein
VAARTSSAKMFNNDAACATVCTQSVP